MDIKLPNEPLPSIMGKISNYTSSIISSVYFGIQSGYSAVTNLFKTKDEALSKTFKKNEGYIIPSKNIDEDYKKILISNDYTEFFFDRCKIYVNDQINTIKEYEVELIKKIKEIQNIFEQNIYTPSIDFVEPDKKIITSIEKREAIINSYSKQLKEFALSLCEILNEYIEDDLTHQLNITRLQNQSTLSYLENIDNALFFASEPGFDRLPKTSILTEWIKTQCTGVFYTIAEFNKPNDGDDNTFIRFKMLFSNYVKNIKVNTGKAETCDLFKDMNANGTKLKLSEVFENCVLLNALRCLQNKKEQSRQECKNKIIWCIRELNNINTYIFKINKDNNYKFYLTAQKLDFILSSEKTKTENKFKQIKKDLEEYIKILETNSFVNIIEATRNQFNSDSTDDKITNASYNSLIKLIAEIYNLKYQNISSFNRGNVIINLKLNSKNEESRIISNNGVFYEVISDKNRTNGNKTKNMNYIRKFSENKDIDVIEIKKIQKYVSKIINKNIKEYLGEIKNILPPNENVYRTNADKFSSFFDLIISDDANKNKYNVTSDTTGITFNWAIQEIWGELNSQKIRSSLGIPKSLFYEKIAGFKQYKKNLYALILFIFNLYIEYFKSLNKDDSRFDIFIELDPKDFKVNIDDMNDELLYMFCDLIAKTSNKPAQFNIPSTTRNTGKFDIIKPAIDIVLNLDINLLSEELVRHLNVSNLVKTYDIDKNNVEDSILLDIKRFEDKDVDKFYNKIIIPNTNDLYKIVRYEENDIFEYIEIQTLPKDNFILSESTQNIDLLSKIEGFEDFKEEMNYPYYIQSEKSDKYIEYIKNCIDRVKKIIEHFGNNKYASKFSLTIINSFKKIFQFLEFKNIQKSQNKDFIKSILLLDIIEIFLSVSTELIYSGSISLSDLHKIELMPVKLNEYISMYNESKGDKTELYIESVDDTINKMNDPSMLDESLYLLHKEYVNLLSISNLKSSKLFEINNNEVNLSTKMDLYRSYEYQTELTFKEVRFDNDNIAKDEVMKSLNYKIQGTKFEISNRYTFFSNLPTEILLNFYDSTNIKNIYILILNNAYKKYPTYRMTTRYSRNITRFGAEINGVKFPPYLISGNASNSQNNEQFLENLSSAIDLQNSSINKLNYSLDTSTTMYITKKLYGSKDTLFNFVENHETYLNFIFGYENEVLGKFLQVINMERVKFLIEGKIPLDQLNIKLIFENLPQEPDDFSDYEMLIITEQYKEYIFS